MRCPYWCSGMVTVTGSASVVATLVPSFLDFLAAGDHGHRGAGRRADRGASDESAIPEDARQELPRQDGSVARPRADDVTPLAVPPHVRELVLVREPVMGLAVIRLFER